MLTEQLLAPVPGGTGRYTAELYAALARTAPPGWTVVGASTSRHELASRKLPLPRRALVAAWEQGLPYGVGLHVHAPTPLAPPKGAVVTVHDTVPWTHPETLTPRGVAWHRKVITRATRTAKAIVVPTETVKEELGHYAPGPVPVHVIPNGVTKLTGEQHVDVPEKYVLAIGTIEPRKGFDLLVKATETLQVPLVVAGPQGWGGIDLRAPHVHLLGRITDAELGYVLHHATVLAAPSYAEGFGLPVVEAMAAGIPVVHSDAPALVEVAGGAGTVFARGDLAALTRSLRTVLADPGHTVADGSRRAAAFTWEKAAEAVWRLHV